MTSEDCRRSLLTYYCWSGGCKKAIQDMKKSDCSINDFAQVVTGLKLFLVRLKFSNCFAHAPLGITVGLFIQHDKMAVCWEIPRN